MPPLLYPNPIRTDEIFSLWRERDFNFLPKPSRPSEQRRQATEDCESNSFPQNPTFRRKRGGGINKRREKEKKKSSDRVHGICLSVVHLTACIVLS
ncbi:hypothetical protein TNIN_317631 [Trichonephila inaurata madagascariensis]|uniref:Uncharacterized protein n=1 Tax=Trichonephila inaurata madagascariensis TaxID=2747483 RepID=A0A8X6IKN6_9ARAC|nr:hypothetical protein TNIN_317631 [Trichonephila inaurata madagascariensis]